MRIAIIGSGFSATSLILELLEKGGLGLSIILIEKEGSSTHGPAFDTPYPWHLLNVRAGKMGALADDPGGFYDWLQANEPLWRQEDPAFNQIVLDRDEFLPRKLYGMYLTSLLRADSIEFIKGKATDIEPGRNGLTIMIDHHSSIVVDKVVLAIGLPAIRELSFVEPSDRYVSNLWDCDQNLLVDRISTADRDSVFFIIGTGLTMIDMVTTLYRLNYPGKIIALSRHGILPAVHVVRDVDLDVSVDEIVNAKGLLKKFRSFRKKLQKCDWRQLVDGLRPYTVELWKGLSLDDKRRFMRHLLSLWNKHRHRMAPESARIIKFFEGQNRLTLLSGAILSVRGLEVSYKTNGKINKVSADYVFNCAGPDFTLRNRQDVLVRNLLKRGLIQPDELGLGIKTDDQFQASEDIFVMGSLLYGSRFETTSAPDIRNHSKAISSSVAGCT